MFNYTPDPGEVVLPLGGADYLVNLMPRRGEQAIGDGEFVVAWEDTTGFVVRDRAGVVISLPIDSLFAKVERSNAYDRSCFGPRRSALAAAPRVPTRRRESRRRSSCSAFTSS